jgi:hypothetical protein
VLQQGPSPEPLPRFFIESGGQQEADGRLLPRWPRVANRISVKSRSGCPRLNARYSGEQIRPGRFTDDVQLKIRSRGCARFIEDGAIPAESGPGAAS